MAVEEVRGELASSAKSLIAREEPGDLSGARLLSGAIRPNAASYQGHTGILPKFGNRKIRGDEHGFSRRESSSRTGGHGLFRGHSLPCRFANAAGDGLGFRECDLISGRCSCITCTPKCRETRRCASSHRAIPPTESKQRPKGLALRRHCWMLGADLAL